MKAFVWTVGVMTWLGVALNVWAYLAETKKEVDVLALVIQVALGTWAAILLLA